ncbi:hypothetical protein SCUP234_09115 [Seiridium cupressi]
MLALLGWAMAAQLLYVVHRRESTDTAACGSLMQSDSSFTISQYISTDSGTRSAAITPFYSAGNWIFANGIVVRRSSGDPTWDVATLASSTSFPFFTGSTSFAFPTTSTSTTDFQLSGTRYSGSNNIETDSGLTTGAKVGIGVGSARHEAWDRNKSLKVQILRRTELEGQLGHSELSAYHNQDGPAELMSQQ